MKYSFNVLVVEDVVENQILLDNLLTSHGYEVRIAKNAADAFVSIYSDPPDLILLDIKLPDKSGFEVCTHLKEDRNTNFIPIIFISALTDAKEKVKGFACGAVDYITKPFIVEEVLIRVQTHITKSFLLTELEFKHNQLKIELEERKKSDEEKKQLMAQLFHTSKLASIGTFAAGVAHEINNPLALIAGHVDIVKDNCLGTSDNDTMVRIKKIKQAIDRIAAIVNGLRTYARQDTETIDNIDVHACLEDTISLVQSIYEKDNIRLEGRLDAKNFLVKANNGKLQQVIMNIVGNARDALKDNPDGKIILSTENKDNGINIKISDNGSGMPQQVMSKIFDPFFTTKDPGKGTGMGLSICYSIITAFGGNIKVASEPNKGTTFTIFLPVDENAKLTIANAADEEEEYKLSGKVLVVDDEDGIRDILSYYLSSFGLEVTEAENGEVAYQKMLKEKFDYVVTDMQMPKMNGHELLSKIKNDPNMLTTKVLLITGGINAEPAETRADAPHIAPDGYVYKPFQKSDIINSFKLMLLTS